MPRLLLIVFLAGLLVQAGEPESVKRRLKVKLQSGDRYRGHTTVTYKLKTVVRHGTKETATEESVQRTERFTETVVRAGETGLTEFRREYDTCFTKIRGSEDETPTIYQSPVKGKTVIIREKRRRREAEVDGRPVPDQLLRRVIGIEMDWRDVLPDEPVGPGDQWDGDATALARRLAAYLNCGTRGRMRVRYEENVQRDNREVARLYIDWTVEGMRDRKLYTKVNLAGDVEFDLDLQRFVTVDLTGTIIVRGAVLVQGSPRIVNGDGTVLVQSGLEPAPVLAASD